MNARREMLYQSGRDAVRGIFQPTPPTWFDTVERRSLLLSVARAWDGTPFFPNSEAPGPDGGVDCVHLENGIYSGVGFMERIEIPPQIMDHGQHSDRSLLIEAFETWPELASRFERVPDCSPANILPGDALCFVAGAVPHHGAVMLPAGEIIHVLRGRPGGVHRMQLTAAIRGHKILGKLAAAFRPLPEPKFSIP